MCGGGDDAYIKPSLFLKKHLPASGLTFFPKSGHVLNLEEPALFNEVVERFIALVEANRWGASAIRGRYWSECHSEARREHKPSIS
jgi:proline iminopeptidase